MTIETVEREMLAYVHDAGGQRYVRNHAPRFFETLKLIPADKPLQVLDLGAFLPFTALLCHWTPHAYTSHGIWEGDRVKQEAIDGATITLHNFDVERDTFPFPDARFDLVLCTEILEHLGRDPLFMLAESNRVLRMGGHLLLSTPNITSLRSLLKLALGYSPYLYANFTLAPDRHNREYAPREIHDLLAYAGFTAERFYTADVYVHEPPRAALYRSLSALLAVAGRLKPNRGDCIFAFARKAGPVRERFPSQFYDLARHAT